MTTNDVLSVNETLTLVVQLGAALNSLWGIYVAVLAGIIALIAAGKPLPRFTKSGVAVIFWLFAISNLLPILWTVRQEALLLQSVKDSNLVSNFIPPSWYWFAAFHLIIDSAVTVAIFAMLTTQDRTREE